MPEAQSLPPAPAPAQAPAAPAPVVVVRPPRRRREELDALNTAFVEMEDEHFEQVKAILGLKGSEEQSVHAMTFTKRRKLKDIFALLAISDEPLRKIARTAIGTEDDSEDEPPPASAASSQPFFTEEDFARSGKCLCGSKQVEGKKVGQKVVFPAKMGKGKKCA
jgi:hypothetical protein